jgi:hypothetical protein
MQTIMVQAIVPEGFDGAWRARRKWPANEVATVEVLDQQDDPPDIEQEVTVEGVKRKRTVPDPNRIGQKSFEKLKADSRIRILGDRDTNASTSEAALNKARAMASASAAENSDLKVKLAGLEEENQRLRQQLAGQPQASAPPTAVEESVEAEVEVEDSPRRRRR